MNQDEYDGLVKENQIQLLQLKDEIESLEGEISVNETQIQEIQTEQFDHLKN